MSDKRIPTRKAALMENIPGFFNGSHQGTEKGALF